MRVMVAEVEWSRASFSFVASRLTTSEPSENP